MDVIVLEYTQISFASRTHELLALSSALQLLVIKTDLTQPHFHSASDKPARAFS